MLLVNFNYYYYSYKLSIVVEQKELGAAFHISTMVTETPCSLKIYEAQAGTRHENNPGHFFCMKEKRGI